MQVALRLCGENQQFPVPPELLRRYAFANYVFGAEPRIAARFL